MKNITVITLAILATLSIVGCSTTTITERTYADDGVTIVSETITESKDSPIVVGVSNLKNKHVIVRQGGWYGTIGMDTSSNSYGITVGSIDNLFVSIVADEETNTKDIVAQFPDIIAASINSITVSTTSLSNSTTDTITEDTDTTEETETSE